MYCNVFLVFFPLLNILLVIYAFREEELIGGYDACKPKLRYQGAITGIYGNSSRHNLLCSAAIIHNFLLLSAAQCFLNKDIIFRRYKFYAIVGQFSLSPTNNTVRDIELFYTYNYDAATKHNDIAVVKLTESLEVEINKMKYFKLEIPTIFEKNEGIGIVAGFGVKSLDDLSLIEGKHSVRLNKIDDHSLTEAIAEAIDKQLCEAFYTKANHTTTFCAIVRPNELFHHRGICVGDIGSSVVNNGKILGIASRHPHDCNDFVEGTLYTNVSHKLRFINSIKRGRPLPETTINYNHAYVAQEAY